MNPSTVALLLTLFLAAVIAVGLAAALAIDYALTPGVGRRRAQTPTSTVVYRTGGPR